MKYRLKDQELQKKLDAISDGDFSGRLQESVSKVAPVVVFCFGESPYPESKHRYMVSFRHDEIEEFPEYDPRRWNEWPEVEPPEDTLLRIEVITKRIDWDTPEPRGGKVRCRGCATYRGGFWMLGEKIRSRPLFSSHCWLAQSLR